MNTEQIKTQIENIDKQLFELDETLSCNDEIDIHRYYELEAKLITQKKLLLTDYENLIVY
jgi:cob(I)alamin adenosyltransferase